MTEKQNTFHFLNINLFLKFFAIHSHTFSSSSLTWRTKCIFWNEEKGQPLSQTLSSVKEFITPLMVRDIAKGRRGEAGGES